MAAFGVSAVQPLVVSDGSQLVGGLGEVGMIVATGVLRCEWWLTIKEMRQRMRADDAVHYWLTVLNACCLSPNAYRLMDEGIGAESRSQPFQWRLAANRLQ